MDYHNVIPFWEQVIFRGHIKIQIADFKLRMEENKNEPEKWRSGGASQMRKMGRSGDEKMRESFGDNEARRGRCGRAIKAERSKC